MHVILGPSFSQDRPGFVAIKTILKFQHNKSILLLYSLSDMLVMVAQESKLLP